MKAIYTTGAKTQGGRAGSVKSTDGVLDLQLGVPQALGGDGKRATNPEQLFAAGYAACFESAIRHIATEQKKQVTDASVTSTVRLGPREAGGFELEVDLDVTLAGPTRTEAQAIVDLAHNVVCPYSNATRGNIVANVRLV